MALLDVLADMPCQKAEIWLSQFFGFSGAYWSITRNSSQLTAGTVQYIADGLSHSSGPSKHLQNLQHVLILQVVPLHRSTKQLLDTSIEHDV
jgi:hypothetical protein